MTKPDRWDQPDWDWIEPIEFDENQFRTWSTITVILLGGVLIGVILAFWRLVL